MTVDLHPPAADGATRANRKVWLALALATLLVHLFTNGRYGFFRDELYYIACARHLDWGYVDMAPLSALLLRIELTLFGDTLFALRLFPALAGAATVALTGVLTGQLGGRVWAVALSSTAAMSALVYLGIGNFYSLNVYEPLFWMGCVYFLVRIINVTHGSNSRSDREPRLRACATLWLAFGALAGLGLENKHSMAFFGAGLAVALVLTPERKQLTRPWIWLGLLVALLFAFPNILWQMQHDWPTPELLSNIARSNKNVVLSPLAFIWQQILIMNPATLPLWLGGLVWLLAARAGGRYRVLGFAYLITLAAFIMMHGKHYYLAPIYPMLFAAGGVATERLFGARWQWLKPALAASMIALAALLAPTMLPVLSPEKLVAYMRAIHFEPPRTETSHTAALPQLFADQFGWEEMVRSVARAHATLSPDEQKRVAIFCQNYGQAGAIDLFGRKHGLPPALSGHQNYFLWGPGQYSGDLVLVLDDPGGDEPAQFRSVEDLGPVDSSPWAMPWEQRNHIYLCRDLKVPLRDAWPHFKQWL